MRHWYKDPFRTATIGSHFGFVNYATLTGRTNADSSSVFHRLEFLQYPNGRVIEINNIRYLQLCVSSGTIMKSSVALILTGMLLSRVFVRGVSHSRAELPWRYRGKYILKDHKLLMFKFLLL